MENGVRFEFLVAGQEKKILEDPLPVFLLFPQPPTSARASSARAVLK